MTWSVASELRRERPVARSPAAWRRLSPAALWMRYSTQPLAGCPVPPAGDRRLALGTVALRRRRSQLGLLLADLVRESLERLGRALRADPAAADLAPSLIARTLGVSCHSAVWSSARWHSTPLTARIRSSVPSRLRRTSAVASCRALSISADACCRCSAALLRGRSRSSRARGCLVGVGWLPAAATGPPVVGSESMQRWQFTPGMGEPSSSVLSDWPRSAGRLGS